MIAASVNCNSCDKGFDVTRAAVGRHLITDCNCHLVSSMVRLDLNQVGNHQTNGFDLPSVSPVACPDPTPVGTHLTKGCGRHSDSSLERLFSPPVENHLTKIQFAALSSALLTIKQAINIISF